MGSGTKVKKAQLCLLYLVAFFLCVQIVSAVPGDWWGTVTIYTGATANTSTDGAIVTAHINSSQAIATIDIVGTPDSGYYLVHVVANSGDNVSFRIYNISVNEAQQVWSEGDHAQLDLTMNKTADGTYCSYNESCIGGYCVHNLCRSAATYCGDGYCDTGESCRADDSACAIGYICTNGCVKIAAPGGEEEGEGAAAGAISCTAGGKRCANDYLQQCNSTGDGWDTIESCEFGCNSTTLACNPAPVGVQICEAGSKRCLVDDLQECSADGTAWDVLETCTYGCNETALACNTGPEAGPAPDYTWVWIILVIIVILLIVGFIYYRRTLIFK